MSPNAVYILGGEVENIVRSHNYIEKHGRKRNPNEIKIHKDSKVTTQNAGMKEFLFSYKCKINDSYQNNHILKTYFYNPA